jgi:hypothetical protein
MTTNDWTGVTGTAILIWCSGARPWAEVVQNRIARGAPRRWTVGAQAADL